jgi:hypothetical protein
VDLLPLGANALGRDNEPQERNFTFDKDFSYVNFDVIVVQLRQHTFEIGYVLLFISTTN